MEEYIYLYHTNDIHSHLQHWPTIHQFLIERQSLHQQSGDSVLTLDIGDFIDRSNVYTEVTKGTGNVELLRQANYDFITIGNNEGITLSKQQLTELYDDDMRVLVANLYDPSSNGPKWLYSSYIQETEKGTRILFIGVTAAFQVFYESLGWKVEDPLLAVWREVNKFKEQADVIVVLSHLGMKDDERLAHFVPQIDIILGAHTHHVFHEGKIVGNSLQGAAGKFGQFIGMIELEINNNKKIVNRKAKVYDTNELVNFYNAENLELELHELAKKQLQVKVFFSEEEIANNLFEHSAMSNLFGESLLSFTKADCAIFNAGIFLNSFSQGDVTEWDFFECLPHPINLCTMQLTVHDVLEMMDQSSSKEHEMMEVRGLGFRGTLLGKMIYHNIERQGNEVYINSRKVNCNELIHVVTLDMFTFGYIFPKLAQVQKKYHLPVFIREVFKEYLMKLY